MRGTEYWRLATCPDCGATWTAMTWMDGPQNPCADNCKAGLTAFAVVPAERLAVAVEALRVIAGWEHDPDDSAAYDRGKFIRIARDALDRLDAAAR